MSIARSSITDSPMYLLCRSNRYIGKAYFRNGENAMPFVPVPGVIQLEAVYNQAGQITENTFYYQAPGTPTVTDLEELCAAWLVEWDASLQSYIPNETSLINIKATDLLTNISPVVNWATGLPLAGIRGANILPHNVTLVFTRRTQFRGRSWRGRIYWPGLVESDVTQSQVQGPFVSAAIGALMTTNAVTTTLGVWEGVHVSRRQEGQWLTTGEFSPITTWTSDGTVDSMRRRLPGRGS